MKTSDKLSGISRRDLLKLTGTYGVSSTLLAAGAFTGAMSAANLAKAAESTYEKRFSKEPKFQLKFGAATAAIASGTWAGGIKTWPLTVCTNHPTPSTHHVQPSAPGRRRARAGPLVWRRALGSPSASVTSAWIWSARPRQLA